MKSRFTSGFFAGNRRRLREGFAGTAPIVVAANGLLQRGTDSTFAFAQDANFWYLTGIDEPDIVLVIERDREYLIVPGRSASRQAFDGAVGHAPLAKRSGIGRVYDGKTGWQELAAGLKKTKQVATPAAPPAYVERYGLYTNPARAALAKRLKSYSRGLKLIDLSPQLTDMRMAKQPAELAAIQAAIDITIKTIRAATTPARLKKYTYEYQLEAELSAGFRAHGADGHAFEPIVAGGERACTLHNIANNSALAAGELLLVDCGAQVEHYAADITRTISPGRPSARQRAVHAAVADVQQFAFGLLKPGVVLKDYEGQVERYMGGKLRELGLTKGRARADIRRYYPHGTSHFLGLDVHDAGDYGRPLAAGMVLTVEPGIYIKEEGIGVRIEDDVLVTGRGIKILSQALSRAI